MALVAIETPFNVSLDFELSPVRKRLLAYAIDFALLLLYFVSMKYLYYGAFNFRNNAALEANMGLDILTVSLPMLLYSLVCEVTMNGQTFGKKIINIRVISLDGAAPSVAQYVVRWIFKVFEWPFFFGYTFFSLSSIFGYIFVTGFLGLGVLFFIAINRNNQRLGDLAANTVVVNTKSTFSVDDTIFMEVNDNYQAMFPQVLKLSDRDVNTIKNVINLFYKDHNTETTALLANKVRNVLSITTDLGDIDFLEKLLRDYNYLAAK